MIIAMMLARSSPPSAELFGLIAREMRCMIVE